jgi:hypothetical protein
MGQITRRILCECLLAALTTLCLSASAPALSFNAPRAFPMLADALTTGDFNNDGIPDLAGVSPHSPYVSIGIGTGDGAFQPAVNYLLTAIPSRNLSLRRISIATAT